MEIIRPMIMGNNVTPDIVAVMPREFWKYRGI
jgi:hypothetical protein